MVRLRLFQRILCLTAALAFGGLAMADDAGQELLDQATEAKLSSQNVADLNQVVRLCQEAIAKGLSEPNRKFANEMLAGTLTQRAELVCRELFERPVNPSRVQVLVQMAIRDLEQTLAINPDQAEAQYMAGRLYAQLGETEKGLQALDAAIKLAGNEPALKSKALMIRANLKTDPAARQADFDEAVKLQPQEPDMLRFRGMHYITQNDFKSAITDLRAAVALDPSDAETHEALGLALGMDEQYDSAIESLGKAIELEPDSGTAYTHRARIRAIKGDNPGALADVEAALKVQPGSVNALQLHAELLAMAGKYDEALDDLALLLRAMPENPQLLLQVAMLCQGAKQHKRAIAAYDRTLQVDPRNVAAFRGRADVYLSLGKQAEAIVDYQEALKVDPKNSGVLNNLAWVLATSPEKELRNGQRAIELATKACEETEYKAAHILSTLAASYAEVGDFPKAIDWSTKAVELGTPQLKGQLSKELDSYRAGQPWREATPPEDDALEAPSANANSSPQKDNTADAARGN